MTLRWLSLFVFLISTTLQSSPTLMILRKDDPVSSLNKHSLWLETYLDVPKITIDNRINLPKNTSNSVVFLGSLLFSYPLDKISNFSNSIFCAQSVFESSSIPAIWVKQLNAYFDFVTVPDDFLVDVYKEAGVTIPIFLIPQGSLLEDWMDLKRIEKEVTEPFVFLASGNLFHPRKNHDLLIEAFKKAFGNRDDVQLQIQARCKQSAQSFKIANELISKHNLNDTKNIVFHYGNLNDKEYKTLVLSSDCLVNVTSGEGFSITPREALAVGIPAIVTENTAQITICKSGFVRPVPCTVQIDFKSNLYGLVGHQFNPTVEDVAEALLDVYNNYDHYSELAKQAKPWVEQYTSKELMPKWRSLLYPNKILLGDKNEVTNDYFMTNSQVLYEKMCALFL